MKRYEVTVGYDESAQKFIIVARGLPEALEALKREHGIEHWASVKELK